MHHGRKGTAVQLSPPSRPDPSVTDLATALQAAHRHMGHRPAVSVLDPSGRQEQAMASLAQWAAKGAHLLELDLLLEPGDELHLDTPLTWGCAAVCLAAWWSGIAIRLTGQAPVSVIHEDRWPDAATTGETFTLGDGPDGAPCRDLPPEPWVRAVQSFPDQPPPPRASAELPALLVGDEVWTQAEILVAARGLDGGVGGTIGVDASAADPRTGLLAVVARPLVSASATVVLRGVPRNAADGDRVRTWL